MTSRLDEEKMHPLISNLLGGTLPTMPIKSYNRERMMELREAPLSRTRPDNLSVDFNGDDGKFSPFKWLEHRWEVEGIKNRPSSKKLDSLCAGAEDITGLSPQRRGFSGGCRAPADGSDKSKEHDKDGNERHGKNWRNGSTGGSEKFMAKGAASNDFKMPFQKSGFGSRPEWKKDPRTANKFGQRRDERGGSVSGSEKIPEWADYQTTKDDLIELHGFDEIKKGKKKNAKEPKKEAPKPVAAPSSAHGSRPGSAGLANSKGNVETIEDSAVESAEKAVPSASLPESDQELAALLGLLDSNAAGVKTTDESAPAGGSRLSRFFKKNSGEHHQQQQQQHQDVTNDENVANPVLAKIFGQTPTSGNDSPSNGGMGLKMGVRLEDLEKHLPGTEEKARGNPLHDPSQQAALIQHLQKIAKQQGEMRQSSPPMNGSAAPQQGHGGHMPMMVPGLHPVPIIADPALLATFVQNPGILNAHCEHQLQQAIAAATRANNGHQISQQLHQQLRMAAARNKMFLQQQTISFAQFTQTMHQQQQLQQSHNNVAQKVRQTGPTPSMIPASVQRQLQKSNSNAADSKKEAKASSSSPTEQQQQSQEPLGGSISQADIAMQMKKMQIQQNYAAMMSAMNNGLGMGAWRQAGAAGPPTQQMPPNLQLLMQQQQQQQQMRMMYGKQQHDIMAKLMAMHQHQQQQQQQHQNLNLAQGRERSGAAASYGHQQQPVPQTSVPTELSQVGPIQTPLEKLLASVGVQASQYSGSNTASNENRIPSSVRPMALEDLEKELTAQK